MWRHPAALGEARALLLLLLLLLQGMCLRRTRMSDLRLRKNGGRRKRSSCDPDRALRTQLAYTCDVTTDVLDVVVGDRAA
mmetsp:Transcript_5539/g.10988  ORF Transcript_5539/g.10988 Transcript_5539/m.10988 type:complete len:80 (+) Transcript_5539:780-1019(+)